MAVLSVVPEVRRLPGADRVLAAHGRALPQPDQLCGPFTARMALHAVLAEPPSVSDLARAAGTRIWPHDVAAWRPAGEALIRTGWDDLPAAASIDTCGTNATGLAAGVEMTCPTVGVVPAGGGGDVAALIVALRDLDRPLGLLANLRTGPVAPPVPPHISPDASAETSIEGATWDVGHFVVLWGTHGSQVAIADSYASLGTPGLPPGCRLVDGDALAEALIGRGLLVLAVDLDQVKAVVAEHGFDDQLWST